jgi:hypothetical protein
LVAAVAGLMVVAVQVATDRARDLVLAPGLHTQSQLVVVELEPAALEQQRRAIHLYFLPSHPPEVDLEGGSPL